MTNSRRNGAIDFWKFAFAVLIVMFHSYFFAEVEHNAWFNDGRIAVEFFFIVSGYLMASSATRKKPLTKDDKLGKDTSKFLLHKVSGLLPDFYIAFAIAFTVRHIAEPVSVHQTLTDFLGSIWELLLVFMNGMSDYRANGVVWYISAMLISMLILYPLLRKNSDVFLHIIAPAICVFVFGYLYHENRGVSGVFDWQIVCYKGLLRGFSEICLGCICFVICEELKKKQLNIFSKMLLALVELGGYVGTFIWAFKSRDEQTDYIIIFFLAISIMISFSKQSIVSKLFDNKLCYFLGKFSFPLFLSHYYWALTIEIFFPDFTYKKLAIIYVSISLVNAFVLMGLSTLIRNATNKKKQKQDTSL